MIDEHERVVLQINLPEYGLTPGDVGTVVMIHRGGEGYEVEFLTLMGETVAVLTLTASQVRPVHTNEITHARCVEVPVLKFRHDDTVLKRFKIG